MRVCLFERCFLFVFVCGGISCGGSLFGRGVVLFFEVFVEFVRERDTECVGE